MAHGGEKYVKPSIISNEVESHIETLAALAPQHNPACLAGIRADRNYCHGCPHIVVFDIAFQASVPARAKRYTSPNELNRKYGLRRFGFHGINHPRIAHKTAEVLHCYIHQLRTICCYLGNGCSITAIENGCCVETSMGMTPAEDLVMGTRSGDVTPR